MSITTLAESLRWADALLAMSGTVWLLGLLTLTWKDIGTLERKAAQSTLAFTFSSLIGYGIALQLHGPFNPGSILFLIALLLLHRFLWSASRIPAIADHERERIEAIDTMLLDSIRTPRSPEPSL